MLWVGALLHSSSVGCFMTLFPIVPVFPLSHAGDYTVSPEGNISIKSCTGCRGRARQLGTESWPLEPGCYKCATVPGPGDLGLSLPLQSPSRLTRLLLSCGRSCCPCERAAGGWGWGAGIEGPLRESILTFNKHYANCMQITTHSLRQTDNLSVFRNNNVGPVPWSPSWRAFLSLPSFPPPCTYPNSFPRPPSASL